MSHRYYLRHVILEIPLVIRSRLSQNHILEYSWLLGRCRETSLRADHWNIYEFQQIPGQKSSLANIKSKKIVNSSCIKKHSRYIFIIIIQYRAIEVRARYISAGAWRRRYIEMTREEKRNSFWLFDGWSLEFRWNSELVIRTGVEWNNVLRLSSSTLVASRAV